MRQRIFYNFLPPVLAGLTAFFVYFPALDNGFVNWDDYGNFLQNFHYRGLNLANLKWMFTTFHAGHYIPLTWISFGWDYLLWGLDPFGYHLTNNLWHSLNTALFYCLARRLLSLHFPEKYFFGPAAGAVFASLFFALHPLRVESAVWITQRRDLLSGFFLLLSFLFYLKAKETHDRSWLKAAMADYAFSLISKASGIVFPFLLLILDWHPLKEHRRSGWKFLIIEKIPFFAASFSAAALGIVAMTHGAAMQTTAQHGYLARFAQLGFNLVFYPAKTLFPFNLSPLYEHPFHWQPWQWSTLAAWVFVILVTIIFLKRVQSQPALWAAWIWYVVALIPVSGAAQSGAQFAADRYSYLSCLSWAVLAAGALTWVLRRYREKVLAVAGTLLAAGLWLIIIALLTGRQIPVWKNNLNFWSRIVQTNPDSSRACHNLAIALFQDGRYEESLGFFRKAVEINPSNALAWKNFAVVCRLTGRCEQADPKAKRHLDSLNQ
ncbi:MAG: tetratricopeptide repeat protein [Elusimicrobia bacterium]|nr:tetratricopeptide repeat protein [Elusimicrobiota bacterium]